MATSEVLYKGNLRTIAKHIKSGNELITDAPTDNKGKGEAFSPTDLVATALASCMLTIMGIKAQINNIKFNDCFCEVTKVMSDSPRRISEIIIKMKLPEYLSEKDKKILVNAAKTCPVALSLHPAIKQTLIIE